MKTSSHWRAADPDLPVLVEAKKEFEKSP